MTDDTAKKDDAKSLEAEMRKYGIKRVPVDYFHINGFRYTDLKDAVAQAKRIKTVKGAI
jgi:hypothetical protein